jgi:hypothetical protein
MDRVGPDGNRGGKTASGDILANVTLNSFGAYSLRTGVEGPE